MKEERRYMRILAGVLLVTAACSASAQLYRWTDANGRTHYTDSPPPAGAKNVQKKASTPPATPPSRTKDASASVTGSAANEPYALQAARKNAPVTLYTGPQCEPCSSAHALLNARGVPFKEVLVVDEATAAALNTAVGGGIVPAITVGQSRQQGFQESVYHALLDAAGYPKKGILPARKQAAAAAAVLDEVKPVSKAAEPKETLPAAPKGPYLPR
jgi:glutaredoxin